ncbi:MAG: glucosaminidase domain-containing protein [Traorella sp.]
MKYKSLTLFIIFAMIVSMLSIYPLKANEIYEIDQEEGIAIGSIIYLYDEYGNMNETVVDDKDAITLDEAKEEYYSKFIGGNSDTEMNYDLVRIDDDANETIIQTYSDYQDALNAYESQINEEPSINFAIKTNDTYWKIKYGVVTFKKIYATNSSGNSYIKNTSYVNQDTNASGYINVSYGIDAAYIDENDDNQVIFKVSGVIGLVDGELVDILPYSKNTTYVNRYEISNGKIYHKIRTQSIDSTGKYESTINIGYAPSYLENGATYFSYDAHYFYDDYYKMIDDYRNQTTTNAINPNEPYYNYYQYLPMHSKTNYTAEELNTYLEAKMPSSIKDKSVIYNQGEAFMKGEEWAVNPLMTLGVAINESYWGASTIAISKNNIFGLNAIDSSAQESADTYASVEQCIQVFMIQYVTHGYLDTKNDSRYFGGHLGDKQSGMNVKYASDPYWGEKAASHSYSIDEYLGRKDYQYYSIGIKTSSDAINIYKETSTTSDVIYKMSNTYSNLKIKEMPVIITQEISDNKGWYKIYTDHLLDENQNRIYRSDQTLAWLYSNYYNFDYSYGYVLANSILKVCDGQQKIEEIKPYDIDAFLNKANLSVVDGYIYGISSQNVISSYINKLLAIDSSLEISIDQNNHTNSNQYISTDMKLLIHTPDDKTYEYKIVIKGDVNCDGNIYATDYVKIKNHIMGKSTLVGASLLAADVNCDGKIYATDYVKIKNHIMGKSTIE